jgi:mono/diheme cytochrome c family protein
MRFWVCVCETLFLMIASICWLTPASVRAAGAAPTDIARGKYLVERVGMCGDCHTPHDEKGQPIADQTLRGAPLAFKATVPMPWADKAPNIAGLPGWKQADAIRFLMTGKAYNDLAPRPPMPGYRMNKADATAVVHYLQSLAPGGNSPAAK